MNQNAPQPSFELPSLPGESSGASVDSQGESALHQPEKYVAPPVSSSQAPLTDATTLKNATGQPLPQAPIPLSPAVTTGSSGAPIIADDTELIEKEWVVKAKQIVASTKEDPYAQTREITKFKADYLKKRYNKDLKVEES